MWKRHVTIYIVVATKVGNEKKKLWGILEVYVPRLYK